MPAKKKVVREKVILLVETLKAEMKIELPEGASVTFGPAIPGPRDGSFRGEREYALRIYGDGGKNDLRAVFTGVRSFREQSIPVATAVLKESGKTLWRSDENGFEVTTAVKRKKGFEGLLGPATETEKESEDGF
jgi:hypothetical protein